MQIVASPSKKTILNMKKLKIQKTKDIAFFSHGFISVQNLKHFYFLLFSLNFNLARIFKVKQLSGHVMDATSH